MLTIRQLRYFEVLSETLHFGQAARRLNVSQPALSAQIAQMEAGLGVALFERRPGGASITAEGLAVRERVRRILAEFRDLEAMAAVGQGMLAGELRIGLIASLAPYILPALLARLSLSFPGLDVGVRENLTATLVDDLQRGDLDCVVLALPAPGRGLRTIPLVEEPFLLAVPQKETARIRAPVAARKLRNERLILLEEGHCLRDQALDVCGIAETRDLVSLGATSLQTLLRMVSGGLGVTLVPQSAVGTESLDQGIAFLPFESPAPARSLALAFRASSGRNNDFETLAQIMRDCLVEGGVTADQPPKPG